MNKSLFAVVASLVITALPAVSHAQDSALSFNVSVSSDYRYRGISQSRVKPALAGGLDYTVPGGLYVGAWASTIKWITDLPDGDASVEIDLYGGYKGELSKEASYDVGVLTYQYPSNGLSPSANTTEVYGALTFGAFTAKYSHSLTDTFGNSDSKNSYYVDLSASFEVGEGVMLTPHLGYQKITGPNAGVGSYTDYSVSAVKDFSGFLVGAALVGTDADKGFYSSPVNGKLLGKTGVVLSVKKSF